MVGLPPTPSIHELLDGIRSIVEREYGYHNFPPIPELFYTHDSQLPDPLPTTNGNPLSSSSSSTAPLNEATVSEDVSPTPDLPQSLVKSESSYVTCGVCLKDIKYSNFARHRKTHGSLLRCEGICQFTTKYPTTMAKHRDSDDCLRYIFVMQVLFQFASFCCSLSSLLSKTEKLRYLRKLR